MNLPEVQIRARAPFPAHTTERGRADWALIQLQRWFHIEREVPGAHCGGRQLRIDAILRPKDAADWKDEAPALGVEFKIPDVGGTRGFTAWAAQAIDYTHVHWQGHGRLKIFACPSPWPVLTNYGGGAALMARLLGQLGVGDLCLLPNRGWALLLNDHIVWDQTNGPIEGRRWSIRPKVGSR
jgi:hypothetical protein